MDLFPRASQWATLFHASVHSLTCSLQGFMIRCRVSVLKNQALFDEECSRREASATDCTVWCSPTPGTLVHHLMANLFIDIIRGSQQSKYTLTYRVSCVSYRHRALVRLTLIVPLHFVGRYLEQLNFQPKVLPGCDDFLFSGIGCSVANCPRYVSCVYCQVYGFICYDATFKVQVGLASLTEKSFATHEVPIKCRFSSPYTCLPLRRLRTDNTNLMRRPFNATKEKNRTFGTEGIKASLFGGSCCTVEKKVKAITSAFETYDELLANYGVEAKKLLISVYIFKNFFRLKVVYLIITYTIVFKSNIITEMIDIPRPTTLCGTVALLHRQHKVNARRRNVRVN
uniref:Phlebovirus_G2 domain-containing protein n=1 Tax=Heterorhabditis bacteriophora TaxID=37862 RepID=A0A1I7WAY2_HETBA